MSKSENEIITVSQSSGLASCFSTLLYFYIKAKEEFNFVFAPIDGAEAELLRKGQLNPLLGCMMVSPVYIKLYHRTNQQITTKMNVPEINKVKQACNYILIILDFSKAPFILSRVPEPTLPRVTLSELTFHLFLYKIQPTVYMRLWTRLGKARQLEGKGEGGGGMRAHAKARMLTAILSLLPAILSNM